MQYQKKWVQDFHEISSAINEALIHLNVSIEHVGSTSIPKLAAKPIIDIDIVFDKETAFNEIKKKLARLGYHHNGNQGIPNREVFKRGELTVKHDALDSIAHHLYVCPVESKELQRHILFRDYLIANEEARIQYQNLKYELAEEAGQDRKKYAALKEIKASEFINGIIEEAERDINRNRDFS